MSRAMKILLLSYAYEPAIGGIEQVSSVLAERLSARGHAVRIVTSVPGDERDSNGLVVIRAPRPRVLLRELRWSDVVLQSNVSLALAWPLIVRVVRRPWLVVNHTPIAEPEGRVRFLDRLKQWALPRGATLAVSQYLASTISRSSGVIPNPYDISAFPSADRSAVEREPALLFVGRLVEAKGVDVLLEAVSLLRASGVDAPLVVIGDGPERDRLSARVRELKLDDRVTFSGSAAPSVIGVAMRGARVLAIPSRARPPEALPVVAIEGLASGCVMVATEQGGLPEVVGRAGLIVPPENPVALAAGLRRALTDDTLAREATTAAAAQIAEYHPDAVVDLYEAELNRLLTGRDSRQTV